MPETKDPFMNCSVPPNKAIQFMVKKKRLLLTVEVENDEQADEILRWLFSSKKPMGATLLAVAWDSSVVSNETMSRLSMMKACDEYVQEAKARQSQKVGYQDYDGGHILNLETMLCIRCGLDFWEWENVDCRTAQMMVSRISKPTKGTEEP